MADLGNLYFGVHLKDYTDAEADKVKKKLENLSVKLTIDGSNVHISHTDLIKKQIEDAIKNVSVQSVSINANALKTQLNAAFQSAVPQVSVTLLKGTLGNDLQTYLNSKVFTVSVSITQGNAQNSVNTAFANVSVPVNVTVKASAVIQQLQQSLANRNVKVGVEAKNVNGFITDLEKRLKNKKIKIDVEANQQSLVQSVRQAFQGQSIKAQVKVDVDAQAITNAVQSAINNARFTYNPNGGRQSTGGNQRYNTGHWGQNSSNGLYQTARASVTLGRSLSTNIRLAGELGTSLGNLASVFGIKDILKGVVEIGGQLENQRIALGAILQDGGKATEMFSRIQSLAVKSPFGIMDLNQYTKQLSAYGIEYNELYETMKRMADISAGVGVNMGRIILAFGQVKAAGFLKGTELRQFTEANIPMVEKLAERFSTLEKRIVSAGEVYDMISKKKVTFEDVKSVLWDLTGEGGMFNNMQEVLSESLASKWKNLADAIDVMYGKIADGKIGGWLKSLAEGLTELTKNWEYLATAIGVAAGAYGAFKLGNNGVVSNTKALYDSTLAMKRQQANSLLLTKTYRELTRAEQQLVSTTGRLTIADTKRLIRTGQLNRDEAIRLIGMKKLDAATEAYIARLYGLDQKMITTAKNSSWLGRSIATLSGAFRSLGATLKGLFLSPWTWITVGIGAISEWATHYYKQQEEIEERNKNFAESTKGAAESLERELLKMKDLDISAMNTDEMKIKVKEMTTTIQNEADGWQAILSEIFAKEADGTFKNSVEEQLKLLKAKMEELAEAKKKLMGDDEMYSDAIKATESGFWFWEEDIIDKIKAYNKAVDDNDKKLKQLGIHARDVSEALASAVGDNDALSKELSGKSLNEQVALLAEYSDEWNEFLKILSTTNPQTMSIASIWKANIPSRKDVEDGFADAKKALDNAFALEGEDINNFTERGRQAVYGFVDGMITETATQRPKMQQLMYDWWTEAYNLPRNNLSYKVPTEISGIGGGGANDGSKKDAVAELWKKRVAEIEKAIKMYDKWKKIEGKVSAENRVKGHSELANLFNGAYGFNLDLEDPTEVYEYIQRLLDESKEKQKELKVNIGVKMEDAAYNDSKKEFDRYLNEIKEYIKDSTSKFDLYKQLFELTGDRNFAKTAFENTQVWDNIAKEMKRRLVDEMNKQGSQVELDFTISEEAAKEAFEGKSGLFELWKEIKDRIEKNGIDLKVNTANAIKDTMSFEDRVNAEKAKMDEALGKIEKKDSKEYLVVKKQYENSIRRLEGEWFEATPAFKELFVDTAGMARSEVEKLYEKAKNLVDLITQNTKELHYDAEGNLIGRTFDNKGKPQYIVETTFKGLGTHTEKLEGKVEKVTNAYTRLWDVIRGKEGAKLGAGDEKGTLEGVAGDLSSIASGAAEAAQSLSTMFDALGDDKTAMNLELAGNMLKGISDIGQGIAKKDPFAILGGVTGIITSIAQHHDKKLDRAIQKSQLEVKKLDNAYKNLQTTIERQLGSITDEQASKMLDSLIMQRFELSKQYQAEDEKKKTDQSKLEDYKQQMAELQDQIEHFYEDLAKEQYGVDVKGWAEQIADALTDAFASGEDAAMAFDKTVSEILQGLMKEMVAMEVVMPAMESLKNYMFGSKGIFTKESDKGINLSADEASGLAIELGKLKGTIGSAEEIWDAVNKATGGLLDSTEKASGGLSGGIQSITEDTANLLGSYLNSVRGDVYVQRTLIEQLVNVSVPRMSVLAEAQLRELNQIVANTKRNADAADKIYDLVNRVVDKGSNKLKV